jgi:hypothetical protein
MNDFELPDTPAHSRAKNCVPEVYTIEINTCVEDFCGGVFYF